VCAADHKHTVTETYLGYTPQNSTPGEYDPLGRTVFFLERVVAFQTRYTVLFQWQELYETFINKPPLFSNNQPIYLLLFDGILAMSHQVREELLSAKYNSYALAWRAILWSTVNKSYLPYV
jgi:hypothetical protein